MSNLVLMAIMAAQIWAYAFVAARGRSERMLQALMLVFAAGSIWAALDLGYYWGPFERGEGYFTANRILAGAVLLAVLATGYWRGLRTDKEQRGSETRHGVGSKNPNRYR